VVREVRFKGMKLGMLVKKNGLVMCLFLWLLTHLYIGTALVPRRLKVTVLKLGYRKLCSMDNTAYRILCEHNCKPVLENDIIYPKNQTESSNLASVHSPVVWIGVLFSGAAFCLHLEG